MYFVFQESLPFPTSPPCQGSMPSLLEAIVSYILHSFCFCFRGRLSPICSTFAVTGSLEFKILIFFSQYLISVMAIFVCQLAWAMRCHNVWLNIILGVSVSMFLDEINL